ncbi:MAG: hypothetical protein ABEJ56_01335 [Candidatus Nanohaloarchaea archaeon]
MIVGFNVDSLNAERKEGGSGGDLKVNYNPEITEIEEAEVSAMDDKVAKINFEFTVSYDVGDHTEAEIVLEGNILWKGHLEEIIEEWDENEELPDEIEAPLMNDLYRKCISQSVGIADTLNLLPPIPTPRIDR